MNYLGIIEKVITLKSHQKLLYLNNVEGKLNDNHLLTFLINES